MTENSPHQIVFIGSSATGLKALATSPHFAPLAALCQTARASEALRGAAAEMGVELLTFDSKGEFAEQVAGFPRSMPFFIYQLDMLVPGELTDRYAFYNVHRGFLATNRGAVPEVWSVLLGDTETALSIHRINEKFDSGLLIGEYTVAVGPDDDTLALRAKLEAGLPAVIEQLHEHLEGQRPGRFADGGIYRPFISEADYTIDPDDDIATIRRKILCQRPYNGAILYIGSDKHYVLDVISSEQDGGAAVPSFAVGEETIEVRSKSRRLIFRRNPTPAYPPPPVRPPSKHT